MPKKPVKSAFPAEMRDLSFVPDPVPAKAPAETPHLVVRAYAGTGKTFTEIVGAAWAFGEKVWPRVVERLGFEPVPSPEQKAVWDAFAASRGKVRSVTYCAFNKSIVNEFSEKWGWLVALLREADVSLNFATVNSLGHKVVTSHFGRVTVTERKTRDLLADHYAMDPRELERREPVVAAVVPELVGLCKLTMAGWAEAGGFDPGAVTGEVLDEIVDHHDIELNGARDKVYELVPLMLAASLDVRRTNLIDFNDQNWLPLVLQLPVPAVDFLMVDEAQDLPRAKQEFARRLGRRLVVVGDVNQAIYGFAGADVTSIPRMEQLLGVEKPHTLTVTRRCGKAIVQEARQVVKDFAAHESNPEGVVRTTHVDKYVGEVADKDMVLCRVNAPLISQALRFIKAGRKAVVRGRDFGGQLIKFVDKFKAATAEALVGKVDDWYAGETRKENAKRNPSDTRLMALGDKRDCVMAFAEGVRTVGEVVDKMNLVFAGKQCPRCKKSYNEAVETCYDCKVPTSKPDGVLFSSVHRAKGLEAKRVFILRGKGAEMPHPMAKSDWQVVQEWNCLYIAITRAIEELVWVSLR